MSTYSTNPSKISYPDAIRGWWAEARWHPDFLCIATQSGFRSGQYIDEKGREIYLKSEVSNEDLGRAVLEAMAVSRWLISKLDPGEVFYPDVEIDAETSSFCNAAMRETEWDKRIRKIYKLKNKKEVYVPMKRCDITKKCGEIVIKCRAHYPESQNGDCWGFATPEMSPYVTFPDTSSSDEIGAGLRLAFSRCIDLPG
jgi:hypothetical protein